MIPRVKSEDMLFGPAFARRAPRLSQQHAATLFLLLGLTTDRQIGCRQTPECRSFRNSEAGFLGERCRIHEVVPTTKRAAGFAPAARRVRKWNAYERALPSPGERS